MNEEDGTTILISSHILPELHQLATVYGFIHHGKMLQQITDKELDEKCRRHVHIEVDNVEKASCILDERYPESQIKVYLRNVIKVYSFPGIRLLYLTVSTMVISLSVLVK